MALTSIAAEKLGELLHDFNPNLNVRVKPGGSEVIATAPKWTMTGPDLQTLADITRETNVTFDRSGANFRMIIN